MTIPMFLLSILWLFLGTGIVLADQTEAEGQDALLNTDPDLKCYAKVWGKPRLFKRPEPSPLEFEHEPRGAPVMDPVIYAAIRGGQDGNEFLGRSPGLPAATQQAYVAVSRNPKPAEQPAFKPTVAARMAQLMNCEPAPYCDTPWYEELTCPGIQWAQPPHGCNQCSCSSSSSSYCCMESISSTRCIPEHHTCHCCPPSCTVACDPEVEDCDTPCEVVVEEVLDYWDFTLKAPKLWGVNADWLYWQFDGLIADGGTLTSGPSGGRLDTKVYSVTASPSPYFFKDHYKYFIYASQNITMPVNGTLIFEYRAGVKTYGCGCGYFPFSTSVVDSCDDVRLASGTFRVFDANTGLNFGFHMTNTMIYAVYERESRIPPDQLGPIGALGISAGFSYVVPVMPREKDQMHTMRLGFNVDLQTVSWTVDSCCVFSVYKVGQHLKNKQNLVKLLGGIDTRAFPTALYYGFGSFTLLDYYPACDPELGEAGCCGTPTVCKYPCKRMGLVQTACNALLPDYNPIKGQPYPARYYDYYSMLTNRLWGQGSITYIRRIKIIHEYVLLV